MLNDYCIPKYFPEDLFQVIKKRPPFRWILIGPKRSGSMVHQDPLGTSAWNASISGYKLWAMFPPFIKKPGISGKDLTERGKNEPFFWFHEVLPKLQKKFGISPFFAVQKPGDLVFVPSKWWHAVINLTDTIAITQNFVSSINFEVVKKTVKKERKKLYERWTEKLKKRRF